MQHTLTTRPVAVLAAGALLAASWALAPHAAATTGGAAPDASAPAADAAPTTVTDRLVVRYRTQPLGARAGTGVQADRHARIARAAHARGAAAEYLRDTAQGAQVWTLSAPLAVADVEALAAQVAAEDPTVEYAEPDRLMQPAAAAPNDPRWGELWGLQTSNVGIGVLGAWDVTRGAGVNVAVIDTGYRPHADLAGAIVGGYDMISDTEVSNDGNGRDGDASDPGDNTAANQCLAGRAGTASSWHGTHVAGTIAAVAGNGAGVAGAAPASKIVPLRVLGVCGGYTSDIADAMVWASGGTVTGAPANPNRARVLNLSLGGSGTCDTTSQRAITAARANGAVVVVAAGNENRNVSNSSPANCSGVIAVAAYGPTGARASYSNYGTLVDVAAPGGEMSGGSTRGILSTLNTGAAAPGSDTYAYYQGTSMATPHVAAAAALVIAANPSLSPDQVESTLKSTARPFVATCASCGAGMVDANAAVRAAVGATPTPTTPPAATAETEPNNTRRTANLVGSPGTLSATIGTTSDTDYFAVDVPAGATLTARLTPGSGADYDLYLYNAGGTRVARSTQDAGAVDAASVTNTGTATARYYARATYYSGATGTAGTYTMQLGW